MAILKKKHSAVCNTHVGTIVIFHRPAGSTSTSFEPVPPARPRHPQWIPQHPPCDIAN